MFVYCSEKATLTSELQLQYANSIVFIEDTKEIFTHGQFFGISKEYADKITTAESEIDALQSAVSALQAINAFTAISDGTNTAQASSSAKTIKFNSPSNGSIKVTVGVDGVTLAGTTVQESATNGNITVVGPSGNTEVKVHGLNSAAYQPTTAFATPASVTAVDQKADAAQEAADAAQEAADTAQSTAEAAQSAANGKVASVTGENAISVTTGTTPKVTLKINSTPGEVTLTQDSDGLKASTSKEAIGLGNVENKSVAEILTNAALTGTPTAPTPISTDDSTKIATTEFVKDAIAAGVAGVTNALVFKGTLGTDGTVEELPDTPKVGDVYIVSTAGSYGGAVCEVGDMLVCTKAKEGEEPAEWKAVQANINGAITGSVTMTADQLVVGAGGQAVKILGAGSDGQVLKISEGKPSWQDIGKVDSATNADQATKVGQSLVIQLNGGTSEGTSQFTYDGSAAKTVDITASGLGITASSLEALTQINKGTDGSYITTTVGAKSGTTQTIGVSATIQPISSANASAKGLLEANDAKTYIDSLFAWEEL